MWQQYKHCEYIYSQRIYIFYMSIDKMLAKERKAWDIPMSRCNVTVHEWVSFKYSNFLFILYKVLRALFYKFNGDLSLQHATSERSHWPPHNVSLYGKRSPLKKLQELSWLFLSFQFLCHTLDANIFSKVAETGTATCDFLHVGLGEPAPFPVGQPDAFHPT